MKGKKRSALDPRRDQKIQRQLRTLHDLGPVYTDYVRAAKHGPLFEAEDHPTKPKKVIGKFGKYRELYAEAWSMKPGDQMEWKLAKGEAYSAAMQVRAKGKARGMVMSVTTDEPNRRIYIRRVA